METDLARWWCNSPIKGESSKQFSGGGGGLVHTSGPCPSSWCMWPGRSTEIVFSLGAPTLIKALNPKGEPKPASSLLVWVPGRSAHTACGTGFGVPGCPVLAGVLCVHDTVSAQAPGLGGFTSQATVEALTPSQMFSFQAQCLAQSLKLENCG